MNPDLHSALQQFHQPGSAGDFGFLQDVGDVLLHGVDADLQVLGDFRIGIA